MRRPDRSRLIAGIVCLAVLCGSQGCGTQVTISQNGTKIVVNGQTVDLKEIETDVVSETFRTAAKPRIIVDVFSGKITVDAGAADAVKAEITKTCAGETREEAKANLKLIDVQMKQDGDTVRVTARRTTDNRGPVAGQSIEEIKRQFAARSADAVVHVPAGASLELKTAFGDVKVHGLAGRVDAESASGTITVTGGKGEVKLLSSFGNLDVAGQNTAVTAETKSGNVTVKGASGPAKLTSGFGTVTVDGAGAVEAETKSGDIAVNGTSGPVQAKSGFGKVMVDQAPAGAVLQTSSGDIRLKAAQGSVKLTSGFGQIEAEVSGASVHATTKSGNVQVRGRLADGGHELRTSFGNVTVTLPADSRFRLDAETKFGRVTTEFGLHRSGTSDDKHLEGTVGEAPNTVLLLRTDSGNIEVRKN